MEESVWKRMGISPYSFIIFFDKHILYIKNKDRDIIIIFLCSFGTALKQKRIPLGSLVSMKDYTI